MQEEAIVLPINLFEIVIFSIALFTFILTLITIAIVVKRKTNPISFKKRFHFLIPSLLGWIIIFLLLQQNLSTLVVPVSIIIYGLILLNLNRFVTSRLVYFGASLILLGIISFFLPSNNWIFLSLGFGIFPIVFGLILLRKSKASSKSLELPFMHSRTYAFYSISSAESCLPDSIYAFMHCSIVAFTHSAL